ncbi:GDSL esterase/lipase At4g28780 [Linum perenne]
MVFGDSLVDAGNNNYLITTARADTPPNGIDYPGQVPTGRFSNGLNFADLIAEALGIQSPLPFLDPALKGDKLLAGANFASAGIGVLNDTGFQFLYGLGARRILVTGTGPLGCIPAELAFFQSSNGDCATEPQEAAKTFNPKLFDMVDNLNRDVGTDIFISANAFSLKMDMIEKPQLYGFKTSKVACCGQGLYNGVGMCTEMSNLCANRDDYVFWDPYHPTEKALRLMVQKLKNTTSLDHIRPMNLNTMMAVDAITMTMNP